MASGGNHAGSGGARVLPQGEKKRIRDLLISVGRVYPLNGWRSVDWLGYCLDPHGEVHRCGTILINGLVAEGLQSEPLGKRSNIPNWDSRLPGGQ